MGHGRAVHALQLNVQVDQHGSPNVLPLRSHRVTPWAHMEFVHLVYHRHGIQGPGASTFCRRQQKCQPSSFLEEQAMA